MVVLVTTIHVFLLFLLGSKRKKLVDRRPSLTMTTDWKRISHETASLDLSGWR